MNDLPLENPNPYKIIDYVPTNPSINTQEDLINIISSYFEAVNQSKKPPTFTGLSMMLGINRKKLNSFPHDSPFSPIIEKARQYIIDYAEQQLFSPKPAAGVTFWLKNNDEWVDKQDISLHSSKSMKEIIDEMDQKNVSPIIYEQTLDAELQPPA